MRDFILESLTDLAGLNLNTILLNNCVTIVISLFIMLTYRLTYSGTAYSKKFNVSLGMMTIVTMLIMSVISNNIALSLGMVGALSIIRFRTPVKDARDATFIFWSIAVGISCGVSQYLIAAISSAVVFLFLIVMNQTHPEGKLLLIIKCSVEAQNKVQAAIEQYFSKSARQCMKNANAQGCEFVYEISQRVLQRVKKKTQIDIVEKLLKIEGVLNINQVEQNDDISR
ncbi:DUF4956 domain-containing protein [Candidatus Micrarchaeota archaeon]|jgi:uncharacterized membrane protein YhiD involved in acid resistance|nr:DUF4956 domain-containing protein [Candidatus Micrarchaeota archaeon]